MLLSIIIYKPPGYAGEQKSSTSCTFPVAWHCLLELLPQRTSSYLLLDREVCPQTSFIHLCTHSFNTYLHSVIGDGNTKEKRSYSCPQWINVPKRQNTKTDEIHHVNTTERNVGISCNESHEKVSSVNRKCGKFSQKRKSGIQKLNWCQGNVETCMWSVVESNFRGQECYVLRLGSVKE